MSEVIGAAESRAARDEAVARVGRNADEAWKAAARLAVKEALTRSPYGVTTDDVWLVLDERGFERPREPRALGAVMTKLHREKKIVRTNQTRDSDRAVAHRNPKRVWLPAEGIL